MTRQGNESINVHELGFWQSTYPPDSVITTRELSDSLVHLGLLGEAQFCGYNSIHRDSQVG